MPPFGRPGPEKCAYEIPFALAGPASAKTATSAVAATIDLRTISTLLLFRDALSTPPGAGRFPSSHRSRDADGRAQVAVALQPDRHAVRVPHQRVAGEPEAVRELVAAPVDVEQLVRLAEEPQPRRSVHVD